MGNYCSGTAILRGKKDTIDRIALLCDNLYELSKVSGFDGDDDWLIHIFTKEISGEGIFYEGHHRLDDGMELYIRAARTDGEEFFEEMAKQLGIEIMWEYVSDFDDKQHTYLYNADCKACIGKWELSTLEDEDEDDYDEDTPELSYGGVRTFSLSQGRSGSSTMSYDEDGITADDIEYRDIEVQLKLAVAAAGALKYDFEQDYDMGAVVLRTAVTHVFAAATLCNIKLSRDQDFLGHSTEWTEFSTLLSEFASFFPKGITGTLFIDPSWNMTFAAKDKHLAVKLFNATKKVYLRQWPRRTPALAGTNFI